jgi:hypothetical protein
MMSCNQYIRLSTSTVQSSSSCTLVTLAAFCSQLFRCRTLSNEYQHRRVRLSSCPPIRSNISAKLARHSLSWDVRQMGQIFLTRYQDARHAAWNVCAHVVWWMAASLTMPSLQMTHSPIALRALVTGIAARRGAEGGGATTVGALVPNWRSWWSKDPKRVAYAAWYIWVFHRGSTRYL